MKAIIELPVYNGRWGENQLIHTENIRRVKPDRNWTRLELKQGDSLLVTEEYETVRELVVGNE